MGSIEGLNQVFTAPPVDFTIPTISQFYRWNAEKNADYPMLRWYDAKDGVREKLWGEGVATFERVAKNVIALLGAQESGNGRVVGIYANMNQIEYWAILAGAIMAGFVPFAMSHRNSPEAFEHLLKATKAMHVFVSKDKLDVADRICNGLDVHCTLAADLFASTKNTDIVLPSLDHLTLEDPCLILHSSGSTSFPKPIVCTHKFVQQWAQCRPPFDLCGEVLAVQTLPIFHAFGMEMTFLSTFFGAIPAFPPPGELVGVRSPDYILDQATAVNASLMLTAPSFLETWAESPEAIEKLKRLKCVGFGGGPLADQAGDMLAKQGVPIVIVYGLTEVSSVTGLWCKSSRTQEGEWAYWEMRPAMSTVLIPVDGMERSYRLIVKQNDKHVLAKSNMVMDDGSLAYDTNDIIQQHPRDPKLWKVVGRFDDQIMHSNGEKTNPGPIETILRQSSYIQDALMFGRARFHAGVLLSLTQQGLAHWEMSSTEFLDTAWPDIEAANRIAPSHSRILREMIIIATPNKPFEYTPKRSLRKAAVLSLYETEIQQAYDEFDRIGQAGATSSNGVVKATYEEMLQYVREIVSPNVSIKLEDDDDVFRAGGGDSLSAARIRNELLKASPWASAIPADFVFTFPTISKLAGFLFGTSVISEAVGKGAEPEQKSQPAWEGTVVRFREPVAGEAPLILLHGGGGNVYDLWIMQAHFTSGVWGIQITPDTPLTSLEAQTDYYYKMIKAEQPNGPYRIGGYSGSTILALRLARLFEADGDQVLQLALIDQFPTTFFNPLLPTDDRDAYCEHVIQSLARMFRNDSVPRRQKLADEMVDAFHGLPSTELGTMLAAKFPIGIDLLRDFTSRLREGEGESMKDALVRWLKGVKTPVTLYVATDGAIQNLPQTKEWYNLGVEEVYPDARVVRVEGNHFNIVESQVLIKDLQESYVGYSEK